MVLEKPRVVEVEAPKSPSYQPMNEDTGPYRDSENSRLKELVLQRDNEISILILLICYNLRKFSFL